MKRTRQHRYETNLASEFYVLCVLHRLGANATLTLGNKKSVDIVVVRRAGDAITVDVKGVAGPWDWPADNIRKPAKPRQHFLVLVSYEGSFAEPKALPRVWVVPYLGVRKYLKQYTGRRNVSRSALVANGKAYEGAWHILLRGARSNNRLERPGGKTSRPRRSPSAAGRSA
ncbi:MAG: hypothetical protein ACRD2A_10065 [Vicinamibacterales bacterium]